MAYRVNYYARKYGIPIGLARALIGQESGGQAGVVSPKGATGLTQVMPGTAAGMYGISEAEAARRLKNPEFALDAGFRYLAHQKKSFGTWRLALAAYNAGPNAVREFHGIPPYAETQAYVKNILAKAGVLKSGSHSAILPGEAGAVPSPLLDAAPASASPPSVDTKLQGLQALASGRYKPTEQLQSIMAAASQQTANEEPQAPTMDMPKVEIAGGKITPKVKNAVGLVQKYLGTPYVWGGESPKGFDCSGLLQWVWSHVGVQIPRTSYDQWQAGMAVGKKGLKPGDAVFFKGSDSKNGLPGHVGMYIGGGRFIEAPHTGAVVRISRLAGRKDYMGARRYA